MEIPSDLLTPEKDLPIPQISQSPSNEITQNDAPQTQIENEYSSGDLLAMLASDNIREINEIEAMWDELDYEREGIGFKSSPESDFCLNEVYKQEEEEEDEGKEEDVSTPQLKSTLPESSSFPYGGEGRQDERSSSSSSQRCLLEAVGREVERRKRVEEEMEKMRLEVRERSTCHELEVVDLKIKISELKKLVSQLSDQEEEEDEKEEEGRRYEMLSEMNERNEFLSNQLSHYIYENFKLKMMKKDPICSDERSEDQEDKIFPSKRSSVQTQLEMKKLLNKLTFQSNQIHQLKEKSKILEISSKLYQTSKKDIQLLDCQLEEERTKNKQLEIETYELKSEIKEFSIILQKQSTEIDQQDTIIESLKNDKNLLKDQLQEFQNLFLQKKKLILSNHKKEEELKETKTKEEEEEEETKFNMNQYIFKRGGKKNRRKRRNLKSPSKISHLQHLIQEKMN